MAGIAVTKSEVNDRAGDLARTLKLTFDGIRDLKAWLDTQTTEALTALGFTEGEVAVIKSAYGDLDLLRTVFTGNALVTEGKDFRAFAQQLWGIAVR